MQQKIAIGSRRSVLPEEVIMITSESNYSKIYFSNNKCLWVATTLKELSLRFENHFSFIRTHKSFLINKQFIKEIRWDTSPAFLVLTNDFRVSIARRNRTKVQIMLLSEE